VRSTSRATATATGRSVRSTRSFSSLPSGAEALVNLGSSRGAEAPLFHVTVTVRVEGEIKIGIKFPGLKGRNPRWEGYREAWEWFEEGAGKDT
jgi:hypothetical protein